SAVTATRQDVVVGAEVDRANGGRDGRVDGRGDAVGGGGDGVQRVGRFCRTRGHHGDDLDFGDGVGRGCDRVQFRRGTRGARCGDINCLRLRQRIGGRLHLVDDVGRVVKGVDGVVDRQAVFAIAQQPGERTTGRTPGFRPAFGVERYRDLDRVR